jgi:hypothetical protein
MKSTTAILAVAILLAPAARADELRLKDGTKIVGKIVGFDDNSFKVETSYGFALVRRDSVVTIAVSDSVKKPAPEKKPPAPVAEKASPPPEPEKSVGTADAPAASEPAKASTPSPAASLSAKSDVAPPPAAPVAAKPKPSRAAPDPRPPAEEPMQEHVSQNFYINDTYRFRIYKPPSWQVIEGARKMLPGAIVAMGTGDETTYLLIGQEPVGTSLEVHLAAAEKRLRATLENYRALGEARLSVSGSAAVERRFRGSVDEHDWSGVVALIPHGEQVFTIFGMTRADSDLVQIQENVIARVISSLEFVSHERVAGDTKVF